MNEAGDQADHAFDESDDYPDDREDKADKDLKDEVNLVDLYVREWLEASRHASDKGSQPGNASAMGRAKTGDETVVCGGLDRLPTRQAAQSVRRRTLRWSCRVGRKPIRLLLKRVACRTNLHVAPGGYPGLLRDMHEFVSQDPATL